MKFNQRQKEDRLVSFGQCQHIAGLIEGYPGLSVIGLEHTRDEKGLDIILGLDGRTSSCDRMFRVGVTDFLQTHEWCQIRAQKLAHESQKILKEISDLLNPVMPIVYAHGALQAGTFQLSR